MPKGTYIVILKNQHHQTFDVGKAGSISIIPGYYAYIGSAMGPGGIDARLTHHRKVSQKPHWHIDYLRAKTSFKEAWSLESNDKKECEWAGFFANSVEAEVPMTGFGSSDCGCNTHLFYFQSYAVLKNLLARLQEKNTGLSLLS